MRIKSIRTTEIVDGHKDKKRIRIFRGTHVYPSIDVSNELVRSQLEALEQAHIITVEGGVPSAANVKKRQAKRAAAQKPKAEPKLTKTDKGK